MRPTEPLRHSVLDALLTPGARVQLVGAPGVGKSHLARAVSAGWTGAVTWVDLDDVGVDGLSEALARAADVAPGPDDVPFVRHVRQAPTPLLVFDGAEGVAGVLASRLERWFGAGGPRVLVTSRSRAPLPGVVVEVSPLDEEAALALFQDRARERLGIVLDPARIAPLLARLDGLPLAIELAVGRLRLYSPEELADASLDVLADRLRGPRHASLRHAVAAAIDRVSPHAQRALARVSTFDTPFGRRGFLEVSGADVDALEELLDASLVHGTIDEDGAGHYRLLAPVRAVATERLADPDAASAARDRWLLSAALQAARAPGRTQLTTLRRLRPALVAIAQGAPDQPTRAQAAWALGVLTRAQGPVHLLPELCEGWPLWQLASPLREELACLIAEHLVRVGRHLDARRIIDHADNTHPAVGLMAAELLFASGDGPRIAAALDALSLPPGPLARRGAVLKGAAWSREGRHHEAVGLLRAVVAESRDDPENCGLALRYLAMGLRHDGSLVEAVDALEEAIRTHQQAGQRRLEALCHAILALEIADTDPAGALQATATARSRCVAIGELAFLHGVDQHEALVRLSEGQDAEAERILLGADRVGVNPAHAANYDYLDALLWHAQGAVDRAIPAYVRALESVRLRSDAWHERTYAPFLAVATGDVAGVVSAEGVLAELARAALGEGVSVALRERAEGQVAGRLLLRLVQQRAVPRVGRDGIVHLPDATQVDLSRRQVLLRVLDVLLDAEGPVDVPGLLRGAWGPEVPLADGRSRVHVALSHLRQLGLEPWLSTHMTDNGPAYVLRAVRYGQVQA